MAKVTSKYQVTLPKIIAEHYQIHPGDEIDWVPAGDVIRVIPRGKKGAEDNRQLRLRLFDQATQRQSKRSAARKGETLRGRGWAREDLYRRGRSR